jgi:hypothetical protein
MAISFVSSYTEKMKKIIIGIVLTFGMAPSFVLAAGPVNGDIVAQYQAALQRVIALLEQEVIQLEGQLASMSAVSASPSAISSASSSTVTASSTVVASSTSGTNVATSVTVTASNATSSEGSTTTFSGNSEGSSWGIVGMPIAAAGKMPFGEIGSLSFGASGSGPVELGSLTLTFGGNGYTEGSSTFLNTVVLEDQNHEDVADSFGASVVRNAAAGTMTWTFPTSTSEDAAIAPGQRLTLQLWGATDVVPSVPGIAESLSATIQHPGDLTFYDGADPAAFARGPFPLSVDEVPIVVASFSWGQGE